MLNLDDPRAALRQAFGLIKEGRASDALAVLSPILEKDPDNAEAWWLLAHAAATAADSVLACQQVLSLRPGYAPALQMLSEQQLQTARDLIDQKQPREAYATIQAILEREPNNAEAWWLAALTASTTTESAAACQKVLAIAPDHALAQQKLTALQQTLSQSLKVKQKQIKRSKPTGKRRIGCVLALVGLAVLVFVLVCIVGFARHGFRFFSLFWPKGTFFPLAVFVACIEFLSFLSRPFTLAIRLFANMTAGHVLLKVFGTFVVALGSFGALPYVFGILPLAVNVALSALEVLIAVVQAYVFALLASIYLNDAINLH